MDRRLPRRPAARRAAQAAGAGHRGPQRAGRLHRLLPASRTGPAAPVPAARAASRRGLRRVRRRRARRRRGGRGRTPAGGAAGRAPARPARRRPLPLPRPPAPVRPRHRRARGEPGGALGGDGPPRRALPASRTRRGAGVRPRSPPWRAGARPPLRAARAARARRRTRRHRGRAAQLRGGRRPRGRHGSPLHAWRLAAALGPLLQRHGYSDEAFDVYDQGLRAARECADWGGQATLYRHLGVARLGTGDFGDALAALRESLALEREVHGDGPGSARVLSNMAIVHIRLGRFADAQEHLHRALDLLGTDGSAHDRAFFLANLGVVNTKLGRYEEAAACVLRALDIQTGLGNRFAEMLCLVNAGWIYTLSGRLPDARDHLERGLALGRQLGAKEAEARALYLLADCLRRQDENTAALTGARRALVLARQIQDADAESQTLNVLGQVHHALGDPEAARDCYGQVLRLGLEVKAVPAHRGLGRLALDEGDRAAARAHWTKAQAIAEGAGLPEAEEIARDIAALDRS
ncbi:tetratricopeptide repeat protein [Nonomuraea antimicrobica]